MDTKKLKAILERAESWSASAQEEALATLLAIEEEYGNALSPEDRAALERSADDVRNDRFATDADVEAVFGRLRSE